MTETLKSSEVAVVIPFDGERMLISLRPQQSYFGGWWEWPGGKKQPAESLEECARRELLEEIGIEVGPLQEYERRQVSHPDRQVNVTFFVARVLPEQKAHDKALLHRWVTPREALEYKFLAASLPVLNRIAEQLPALP